MIYCFQPFWPMGTGCARGFLAAFDTAWMVRGWAQGRNPLEILAERCTIVSLQDSKIYLSVLCYLCLSYRRKQTSLHKAAMVVWTTLGLKQDILALKNWMTLNSDKFALKSILKPCALRGQLKSFLILKCCPFDCNVYFLFWKPVW